MGMDRGSSPTPQPTSPEEGTTGEPGNPPAATHVLTHGNSDPSLPFIFQFLERDLSPCQSILLGYFFKIVMYFFVHGFCPKCLLKYLGSHTGNVCPVKEIYTVPLKQFHLWSFESFQCKGICFPLARPPWSLPPPTRRDGSRLDTATLPIHLMPVWPG